MRCGGEGGKPFSKHKRSHVMSGSLVRRLRRVALAGVSLVFGLIVAAPGIGRGDDFDRARGEQEVAAQKTIEEVKTSLAQARKLERTKPAEAVRLLKKCLDSLEDDTTLTDSQRTALTRQLR